MQPIIHYGASLRRAASRALHIARHGAAAALTGTGNMLIGTGRALKFCGAKIKPAPKPRPRPAHPARPPSLRRMRAVPQPAA